MSMAQELLIYGAYGYTGKLIVEEAVKQGLRPMLSGRNHSKLGQLASKYDLNHVAFELSDGQALNNALKQVKLVIHCAGPFAFTAIPMAKACIAQGVHYLDITGEYSVFEDLHALDKEAKATGVMLLPGAGFDVVPSDCLANRLKHLLPEADSITLAFTSERASVSRGTAKTMVENAGEGHLMRKGGKLVRLPLGKVVRSIDYGPFEQLSVGISWGDISTAYYSTGIPNVLVLTGTDEKQLKSLKVAQRLRLLLRSKWVKNMIKRRIDKKPEGPSEERRSKAAMYLWGKATRGTQEVQQRLKTPNGYTLTAKTAVLIASKILKGEYRDGYQTPATAYGQDLILEVPGCEWGEGVE